MWREYIASLAPEAIFAPPVAEARIAQVEANLRVKLPDDLKSLLRETDGVFTTRDQIDLIWSIDRIEQENVELWRSHDYRESYMPLDSLLFFADIGVDGIKFAFGIVGSGAHYGIYAWYPIDDGRPWKADTLRRYIEWLQTGKLKV